MVDDLNERYCLYNLGHEGISGFLASNEIGFHDGGGFSQIQRRRIAGRMRV